MEYRYDPRLAARAGLEDWLRESGPGYLYYGGIPLVLFFLFATGFQPHPTESRSFLMGICLGVAGTYAHQFFSGLRSLYRSGDNPSKQWMNEVMSVRLSEDGFAWQSERSGTFTMPWSQVTKIRVCPKMWVLYLGRDPWLLPNDQLTDEQRRFIAQHVADAGGVIVR